MCSVDGGVKQCHHITPPPKCPNKSQCPKMSQNVPITKPPPFGGRGGVCRGGTELERGGRGNEEAPSGTERRLPEGGEGVGGGGEGVEEQSPKWKRVPHPRLFFAHLLCLRESDRLWPGGQMGSSPKPCDDQFGPRHAAASPRCIQNNRNI